MRRGPRSVRGESSWRDDVAADARLTVQPGDWYPHEKHFKNMRSRSKCSMAS
jgi:hypothetical protein